MKDIQASIITEGISTYFTMIIPQKECEITLDDKVYHALSHDLIFSREDMKYQATESLLVYDFQASFLTVYLIPRFQTAESCMIFYMRQMQVGNTYIFLILAMMHSMHLNSFSTNFQEMIYIMKK